ncbi:hypothetical protein DFJ74DRAFT_489435 [Hyaloraphidium curvatum]|nr:hypothetical protein DFJ74DRAFT_489435 [Hyaloraphidium curvatum]
MPDPPRSGHQRAANTPATPANAATATTPAPSLPAAAGREVVTAVAVGPAVVVAWAVWVAAVVVLFGAGGRSDTEGCVAVRGHERDDGGGPAGQRAQNRIDRGQDAGDARGIGGELGTGLVEVVDGVEIELACVPASGSQQRRRRVRPKGDALQVDTQAVNPLGLAPAPRGGLDQQRAAGGAAGRRTGALVARQRVTRALLHALAQGLGKGEAGLGGAACLASLEVLLREEGEGGGVELVAGARGLGAGGAGQEEQAQGEGGDGLHRSVAGGVGGGNGWEVPAAGRGISPDRASAGRKSTAEPTAALLQARGTRLRARCPRATRGTICRCALPRPSARPAPHTAPPARAQHIALFPSRADTYLGCPGFGGEKRTVPGFGCRSEGWGCARSVAWYWPAVGGSDQQCCAFRLDRREADNADAMPGLQRDHQSMSSLAVSRFR